MRCLRGYRVTLQEEAVRTLLRYAGEDPDREGLQETPRRVCKALREMTAGYDMQPAAILAKDFAIENHEAGVLRYGGIVMLRRIRFHSSCEHHLLPFYGQAHIAYIPGLHGRVVGISKLARLVDCFALRYQVQERLTAQIADAIALHMEASAVLVVLEAEHACLRMRGVRKEDTQLVTSEVRGLFRTDLAARQEAVSLLRGT